MSKRKNKAAPAGGSAHAPACAAETGPACPVRYRLTGTGRVSVNGRQVGPCDEISRRDYEALPVFLQQRFIEVKGEAHRLEGCHV